MARRRGKKARRYGSLFKLDFASETAKRLTKLILVLIITLGIAAALVWGVHAYVVQDHYFDITSIEVVSSGSLKPETVRELAGIDEGTNLMSIDLKKIAERLERYSKIEKAIVRRILPNRLNIEIMERSPIIQLRVGDQYFLLDREGVVLPGTLKYPSRGLVLLECDFRISLLGVGDKFERGLMLRIGHLLDMWRDNLSLDLRPIRRIDIDKNKACTLILDRWVKVLLGNDFVRNLKLKQDELGVLLASDSWSSINYIDCRYKDLTVRWKR